MRRVLLSSIMGAAITSVKIDGVDHEFSTVRGVKEDVTEVILNLKKVVLRIDDDRIKTLKIDAKGEGVVKAGDIILRGGVEVINPEHHIATLSERGEALHGDEGEDRQRATCLPRGIGTKKSPSVRRLSTRYSPRSKRVSYNVTPARVGFRTDYDKLTMEIVTDGSISALEALSFAAKIIREQMRFSSISRSPATSRRESLRREKGRNLTTTFTATSTSWSSRSAARTA